MKDHVARINEIIGKVDTSLAQLQKTRLHSEEISGLRKEISKLQGCDLGLMCFSTTPEVTKLEDYRTKDNNCNPIVFKVKDVGWYIYGEKHNGSRGTTKLDDKLFTGSTADSILIGCDVDHLQRVKAACLSHEVWNHITSIGGHTQLREKEPPKNLDQLKTNAHNLLEKSYNLSKKISSPSDPSASKRQRLGGGPSDTQSYGGGSSSQVPVPPPIGGGSSSQVPVAPPKVPQSPLGGITGAESCSRAMPPPPPPMRPPSIIRQPSRAAFPPREDPLIPILKQLNQVRMTLKIIPRSKSSTNVLDRLNIAMKDFNFQQEQIDSSFTPSSKPPIEFILRKEGLRINFSQASLLERYMEVLVTLGIETFVSDQDQSGYTLNLNHKQAGDLLSYYYATNPVVDVNKIYEQAVPPLDRISLLHKSHESEAERNASRIHFETYLTKLKKIESTDEVFFNKYLRKLLSVDLADDQSALSALMMVHQLYLEIIKEEKKASSDNPLSAEACKLLDGLSLVVMFPEDCENYHTKLEKFFCDMIAHDKLWKEGSLDEDANIEVRSVGAKLVFNFNLDEESKEAFKRQLYCHDIDYEESDHEESISLSYTQASKLITLLQTPDYLRQAAFDQLFPDKEALLNAEYQQKLKTRMDVDGEDQSKSYKVCGRAATFDGDKTFICAELTPPAGASGAATDAPIGIIFDNSASMRGSLEKAKTLLKKTIRKLIELNPNRRIWVRPLNAKREIYNDPTSKCTQEFVDRTGKPSVGSEYLIDGVRLGDLPPDYEQLFELDNLEVIPGTPLKKSIADITRDMAAESPGEGDLIIMADGGDDSLDRVEVVVEPIKEIACHFFGVGSNFDPEMLRLLTKKGSAHVFCKDTEDSELEDIVRELQPVLASKKLKPITVGVFDRKTQELAAVLDYMSTFSEVKREVALKTTGEKVFNWVEGEFDYVILSDGESCSGSYEIEELKDNKERFDCFQHHISSGILAFCLDTKKWINDFAKGLQSDALMMQGDVLMEVCKDRLEKKKEKTLLDIHKKRSEAELMYPEQITPARKRAISELWSDIVSTIPKMFDDAIRENKRFLEQVRERHLAGAPPRGGPPAIWRTDSFSGHIAQAAYSSEAGLAYSAEAGLAYSAEAGRPEPFTQGGPAAACRHATIPYPSSGETGSSLPETAAAAAAAPPAAVPAVATAGFFQTVAAAGPASVLSQGDQPISGKRPERDVVLASDEEHPSQKSKQ